MSCMMRWRSCALALTRSLSRRRSKLRFSSCSRSWMRVSSSVLVFSTSASERTKRSISAAPSAITSTGVAMFSSAGLAKGSTPSGDEEVVQRGCQRDQQRGDDEAQHQRVLAECAARERQHAQCQRAQHDRLPQRSDGQVERVARQQVEHRPHRGEHRDPDFGAAVRPSALAPQGDRRECGEHRRAEVERPAAQLIRVVRQDSRRSNRAIAAPRRPRSAPAARTGSRCDGGTRVRRSRPRAARSATTKSSAACG